MPKPKAKYEITAEDKSAQAWKSALGHAEGFSNKLKSIFLPVASGAAFASFIQGSLSAADAVGDAADRVGVLASEMSKAKYIAEQSDVSFESLEVGIKRYQKTLSLAAEGNKEASESFAALNLSADQLRGKRLDQQLGIIADAFRDVIDPADRTRFAMELFGKSGADLIPMLNRGSSGMAELAAEADRLGITLDDRATKAIDRNAKALDKLWQAARSGTSNFFGGLAADFFGSGDDLQSKLLDTQAILDRLTDSAGKPLPFKGDQVKFFKEQEASIKQQIKNQEFIDKSRQDASNLHIELLNNQKTAVDALALASNQAGEDIIKQLEREKKAREDLAESIFDAQVKSLKNNYETEKRLSDDLENALADDREEMAERIFKTQSYYFDLAADEAKKSTDEMSEYAKSAAQNMQSAFADFLFDPFKGGLKGMLSSFIDTIRRMAAEAASAKVFEALFGKGGGGDFLGAALGFAFGGGSGSSAGFSGPRASGGSVSGGSSYLVGERGPELFTPGSSGNITPNNKLGGSVTTNVHIDMRNSTKESMMDFDKKAKAIGDSITYRVLDQLKRRNVAL